MRRIAFLAISLCGAVAGTALGQDTDTLRSAPPQPGAQSPSPVTASPVRPTAPDTTATTVSLTPEEAGVDTALRRAEALVGQGRTAAGRAVVDSVLRNTRPASLAYAAALYARASLATSADSAEQDYRRITVEYPSSPREPDALLRLAQLELARGDREQAAAQLARLDREQAPGQSGVGYARTRLQVGLAYFDLQDAAHACAALVTAKAAAPSTDVELRNRIDYNAQRCPRAPLLPAAATASGAGPPTPDPGGAGGMKDSAQVAPHQAIDTARVAAGQPPPPVKPSRTPSTIPPPSKATPPTGPAKTSPGPVARYRMPGYTVQVAAYGTRAAADDLAARLKGRGYAVRVVGATAPYRVRVGRYTTEREADAEARALKAKGITGFVAEADPVMP